MNITLFFTILLALGGLSLYFGKRASKSLKTQEGYFLHGRSVRYLALTITILATQLGGGTLIGISDEAYHKGWIALLYSLGIFLGLCLLSFGVGAKLRQHQVTTLPELFKKVYGSSFLRIIAGLLSAFSMWAILIAQGVASRKFFAALGYPEMSLFLTFWSVVIAYTVMGGFGAVVSTDIVQTIFMVITLISVSATIFINLPDLSILSHTAHSVVQTGDYLNWLIMPMLFMVIGQDMGQRCSSAITPKTVSKATFSAAIIYFLLSFIPASLGIIAHQMQIPITHGQSILLATIQSLTNPSITALAACAILMAIISTANSLLCALSANLAVDVWPKQSITANRWLTLIGGVSAILLSLSLHNIVPLIIMSYEASIYVMFAPIFFSIWLKHPPRWLCFSSIGFGLACFLLQYFGFVSPLMAVGSLLVGNIALWAIHRFR